MKSKRRWSFYDPDAPARLYNRDLKVGDLMLDVYGDFYRCIETSEEHFSDDFGTNVIDMIRFVSLTSEGFHDLYNNLSEIELDECWIWHSRVGSLV